MRQSNLKDIHKFDIFDFLVNKFDKTTWNLYEIQVNVVQDYVYDRDYWVQDGEWRGSSGFKPVGKPYDGGVLSGPEFVRSEEFINTSSGPLPRLREVKKIYYEDF